MANVPLLDSMKNGFTKVTAAIKAEQQARTNALGTATLKTTATTVKAAINELYDRPADLPDVEDMGAYVDGQLTT